MGHSHDQDTACYRWAHQFSTAAHAVFKMCNFFSQQLMPRAEESSIRYDSIASVGAFAYSPISTMRTVVIMVAIFTSISVNKQDADMYARRTVAHHHPQGVKNTRKSETFISSKADAEQRDSEGDVKICHCSSLLPRVCIASRCIELTEWLWQCMTMLRPVYGDSIWRDPIVSRVASGC